MAKKQSKKTKIKSRKKKLAQIISTILVVSIIILALLCYLFPNFYNSLIGLFNKNNDKNNLINEKGLFTYESNVLPTVTTHFIDVGQGDCIFIELPDTRTVLIDSGDRNDDNNAHMVNYIKDLGVTTIDYFILTHADADHIGGASDIFKSFYVENVFRPYVKYSGNDFDFEESYNKGNSQYVQPSKTYGETLDYILNEKTSKNENCKYEFFNYESDFGCEITYNNQIYTYKFDFLTPVKSFDSLNYSDANDYSPIIKFSFMNYDILFTGDTEEKAEKNFLENYTTTSELINYIDIELLKVAHHGSLTSTTKAFLDVVKPEVAVIQCGTGNKYYHPRQDVLDRLLTVGCNEIYRNDNNGDIVAVIDSSGKATFKTDKVSSENLVAPLIPDS